MAYPHASGTLLMRMKATLRASIRKEHLATYFGVSKEMQQKEIMVGVIGGTQCSSNGASTLD